MKLTGAVANRQSQLQHYGNRLSNEVIKQKERCEKDGRNGSFKDWGDYQDQKDQKRITQTNLAKKLKISQTHLSNAENGRVMLSLKALLKLRYIFECTLDELVDPDRFEKKKERVKRYKLVRCSE